MKNQVEQLQFCRKKQNQDIIRRMKEGDSLRRYDTQSSWYPPRPIIKKDREAISKLYGSRVVSIDEDILSLEESKKS